MDTLSFGQDIFKDESLEGYSLYDLSKGIHFIRRSDARNTNILKNDEKIKKCILEANRIIFLGFGWDTDNLKILCDDWQKIKAEIYGTFFKSSFPNHFSGRNDGLRNLNCIEYLEKLSRNEIFEDRNPFKNDDLKVLRGTPYLKNKRRERSDFWSE